MAAAYEGCLRFDLVGVGARLLFGFPMRVGLFPMLPCLPLFFRTHRRLWAASALFLGVLGGCRNQASEQLAREAIRGDLKEAKSSLTELKNVSIKDWDLSGRDSQRRPLWRVTAKETRIGEGSQLSPRRATLLGARAELFRDGKLESSFDAGRIEFLNTPQGLLLKMSQDVRVRTAVAKPGKTQPGLSSGPVQVSAPRMDVQVRDKRVWAPSGAKVTQGEGRGATEISARTLRADSALNTLSLGGGVQAKAPQGTLRADRAQWNWKSDRLEASGNVQAASGATMLKGARIEADARARRGLLSGGVSASTSTSGGGRASAASVRFDWGARTLSARSGVTLEKDGAKVSAARLDCNAELGQAVASGDVRLEKDGAVVRAGRVEGFEKGERVAASGGVTLSKGAARIVAASLESFDGGARVVASGDVSLSQGQAMVRAQRVEAFDRFTRAVASGGVRLQQGLTLVRAERVEAFDLMGSGRAVASGGATVSQGGWVVTAGALEARSLRPRSLRRREQLEVAAQRGVSGRSSQGSVRAASVDWRGGRVLAKGGVQFSQNGSTLSGQTLEADDRLRNATLRGSISGTLAGGTRLSAGVVQKQGERIQASGGITARRGGMVLTAARLETSMQARDVLLSGGVSMRTSDGATLAAPSVRYDKSADKVYGSGGVRYADPKRGLSLRGRSVVVNRVSDEKRREAVMTGVQGQGSRQSLEGLELF
jgi:lipopolysaccharide export system protein LptA